MACRLEYCVSCHCDTRDHLWGEALKMTGHDEILCGFWNSSSPWSDLNNLGDNPWFNPLLSYRTCRTLCVDLYYVQTVLDTCNFSLRPQGVTAVFLPSGNDLKTRYSDKDLRNYTRCGVIFEQQALHLVSAILHSQPSRKIIYLGMIIKELVAKIVE